MKKTFFILLLLLPFSYVSSQEKTWKLFASIVNSFTQQPIKEAIKVELMLPDSTVVDSTVSRENNPREKWCIFSFVLDGSNKDYILRLSHPDYSTLYKSISLKYYKREKSIYIDNLSLRKLGNSEKEKVLNEVVVTTTKVKFFNKGDTLIYNADAFQLAEGSMLDELIAQLPGAELKEDGKIYVNGKFVESLLLNGRDFFKGDNTIMLDNLPAYMVKDLKVYTEESKMSKLVGQKVDEGRYVMDVQLKRQYSVGWIANTEWGAGTKDRYLGRLFAMRFTPQSRLTFFGNLNNLNDNRKPGRNGDWSPSDLSGGLTTTKTGGLDYGVYDKYKHFQAEGSAQVLYTDHNNNSQIATTNFLPSGNTYSSAWNDSRDRNTKLTTKHLFEVNFNKNNRIGIYPSLNYTKYNSNYSRLDGTFSENPFDIINLRDSLLDRDINANIFKTLINRVKQTKLGKGHNLDGELGYFMYLKIPHTNDGISISGNASYSDTKNETFDRYHLEYSSAESDFRDRYLDAPNRNYAYSIEANYFYHLGSWLIVPIYSFEHRYSSATNNLYRLDQIAGWDSNDFPLGMLPSTTEDLKQVLDQTNSYETREHITRQTGILKLMWNGGRKKNGNNYTYWDISLYPTIVYEEKQFNYAGSDQQRLENTAWLPRPHFEVKYNTAGYKHELKFNYRMNTSSPSMINLLDLTFDANPLNIRKGNPDLKNTISHQISLDYRADKFLQGTGKMLNSSVGFSTVHNAVAMGYIYDKSTGVRVTTPENVNGNWQIWFNTNHTTPIDKARKIILSNNTQINYSDNADLVGINNAVTPTKSIVHNLFVRENLNINYRLGKHSVGAKIHLGWTNATSDLEDFSNINAVNLNYGFMGQINLPLQIQLQTDLTLFTRRGYNDENMNTTELVWNARLSKSILKGNLVFTLDGFDILGNLRNVNYSLNAQGRTETWVNSIPRYVMLRVIYKLNKQPKKKVSKL